MLTDTTLLGQTTLVTGERDPFCSSYTWMIVSRQTSKNRLQMLVVKTSPPLPRSAEPEWAPAKSLNITWDASANELGYLLLLVIIPDPVHFEARQHSRDRRQLRNHGLVLPLDAS